MWRDIKKRECGEVKLRSIVKAKEQKVSPCVKQTRGIHVRTDEQRPHALGEGLAFLGRDLPRELL